MILLGEAFAWDTAPEEMNCVPFYRLMGFVIDERYRNYGIGGYALEKAIELIYDEFVICPIALGVHKDNFGAEHFHLNHGFRKTEVMEGNTIILRTQIQLPSFGKALNDGSICAVYR